MITEMAKMESRKVLADLIKVIDEEGFNNIIDLLKVVKRDFRPNHKLSLIQCIAETSSSMMWRQHECERTKTMKSMFERIDRLESSGDGIEDFKKDISLRSDPLRMPENTKQKKSILKVIAGGK